MIDFDILKEAGTTNERLREFFTAKLPDPIALQAMSKEKREALEHEVKQRKRFESLIGDWLNESIVFSLQNHKLYTAVDIAWDSTPIQKQMIPLLMYAQGRIDTTKAAEALQQVPDGATYVKRNEAGRVTSIDLPKFSEMNINLLRSVITRRTAAQEVKYGGIWPFWHYEPRSTTQVGKLRGDLISQRMDIMADQYGHRHFQTQVTRDMFLYPNGTVAFPRCSWEREVQWSKAVADTRDPNAWEIDETDPEPDPDKKRKVLRKVAKVVKEGVCWVNPHPSRIIRDNNYPLASLNTDSGCEHIGFWDVTRFKDIHTNPCFFNRDSVNWSSDSAAWFSRYASYFNQYFDTIKAPWTPSPNAGEQNDLKTQVGVYTGEMANTSVFFSHLWMKVIPRDWGWGKYPFPIWVHLKVAGDSTVIFADIMPSSPGAAFQFNCHDGRALNISLAHELLQYQDQLSNLFSQLLETIKADLFCVAILNRDVFPETDDGRKVYTEFKRVLEGKNFYASMQILDASFEKLSQLLGKEVTPNMVFQVVRSSPNTAITAIFEAITRVIAMAEKLMVMSPHEQGQAATHEISATESNQMAGSTDTIYSFISGALDEGRAAMKRIMYESVIACGEDNIELPVVNRYSSNVIAKAGLEVKEQDEDDEVGFMTVMGRKLSLAHDYIFTSRDGGDRPSNSQAATVLVQMLQAIGSFHPSAQNAVLSSMGKEKLFEIVNAIFRLADTGVDLKLEIQPGDDNTLLLEDDQQVMNIIKQLGDAVKRNSLDVQKVQQAMGQIAERLETRQNISINYKDAPPSVQRQMEQAAGLKPATETETALALANQVPS